jgi:hypothetical protein
MADYPGEGGIGLSAAIAFALDGKGYVGTGGGWAVSPFRVSKQFWEYDTITNAWTRLPDLPDSARWFATVFTVTGKGYVGTGEDISGDYHDDFWEYDPDSSVWIQRAPFPGEERRAALGFSLDSSGYITTGARSSAEFTDLWEWYQPTDSWSRRADYPGADGLGVALGTAFALGDHAYAGTGVNPNSDLQVDFWKFNPDSVSGMHGPDPMTLAASPSPTTGPITIQLDSDHSWGGLILVSNSVGQIVLQGNLECGNDRLQLDLITCPSGLYTITLFGGTGIWRGSVVKQ